MTPDAPTRIGDLLPDALTSLNNAAHHIPATPEQLNLLTYVDSLDPLRPEPDRDRYNRYRLRHPRTGRQKSWTRVTTFCKAIDDTFNLERWTQQKIAVGLTLRPELLTEIASHDPDTKDGKKAINALIDQAKEAGGAHLAADVGTAIHTLAEHADLGTGVTAPAPWDTDIAAYTTTLDNAGITRPPEWIERIVLCPDLSCAGTFDRLITHPTWNKPRVADIKTGSIRDNVAIQLAIYAHSTHMWDHEGGALEPMPDVDTDVGIVIHLPAGEATCTLHEVDLVAGWEMAQTCAQVRRDRGRKGLVAAADITAPPAAAVCDDEEPADRMAWIRQRITAVGHAGDDARTWLGREWPDGVPTPKALGDNGQWTDDQINQIAAALTAVEAHAGIPFHTGDPANTPPAPTPVEPAAQLAPTRDTGDDGAATPAERGKLKARVAAMTDAQQAVLRMWGGDGQRQSRPWAGAQCARHAAICNAALACITHLDDVDDSEALTRAALAETLGADLEPSWLTGAVLGSLTLDEAQRLHQIADAFGEGDDDTVTRLGARLGSQPAA